jgi:hypothetical protein
MSTLPSWLLESRYPITQFNYCCWRSNNQEGRIDIPRFNSVPYVTCPNPVPEIQMSYVMVFLRFWDERWLFHLVNIGGILFQHFFSLWLYYCMTVSCEHTCRVLQKSVHQLDRQLHVKPEILISKNNTNT